MSDFIIYGLIDHHTGQLRYVGKSQRGLSRPKQHTMPTYLKTNTHKNNWIRQLLSEGTGPEIVVLQEFEEPKILAQAEIHWIAYFRAMVCPLTNQCRGGEGFTGKHSDESKARIGEYWKGRKRSAANREKISRSKKGVPLSPSHRKALRVPHSPISELTKQKMSAAHKLMPINPNFAHARLEAINRQKKPIVDSLGRKYEGQSDAARQLNLHQGNILKVLKGRLKTTGGLSFKYL